MEQLEQKYGIQALNGSPGEIDRLTREAQDLQAKLDIQTARQQLKEQRELGSEDECTDSEEEEYADDLPEVIKNRDNKPRKSVSAEAFGQWN